MSDDRRQHSVCGMPRAAAVSLNHAGGRGRGGGGCASGERCARRWKEVFGWGRGLVSLDRYILGIIHFSRKLFFPPFCVYWERRTGWGGGLVSLDRYTLGILLFSRKLFPRHFVCIGSVGRAGEGAWSAWIVIS